MEDLALKISAHNGDLLQWDHGEEAVEDEPGTEVYTCATKLQWGHGAKAVEDESFLKTTYAKGGALQWGHGAKAVEDGLAWFAL